ncbi:unnamed protein product, partial [Staurois parvus]
MSCQSTPGALYLTVEINELVKRLTSSCGLVNHLTSPGMKKVAI